MIYRSVTAVVVLLLPTILDVLVRSSPDTSRVIFPGSSSSQIEEQRTFTITPCPDGSRFCSDNIEDYPTDIDIDAGLHENKLVWEKIFDRNYQKEPSFIATRLAGKEGEVRACEARKSVVFPKKAQNSVGKFVFIVNHKQYRQGVEIEQCRAEGDLCKADDDAPLPKSTACKQIYATYKLYAITEKREQVYDSFSLPSACICHHSSPLRSASRNFQPTTNLPFCKAATPLSIQRDASQSSNIQRQSIQTSQQRYSTNFGHTGSRTYAKRDDYSRGNGKIRIRRKQGSRFAQSTIGRWERNTDQSKCDSSVGSYCTSPRNYPQYVLTLLQANSDLSGALYKQVFDNHCSIPVRTRSFYSGEPLCSSSQQIIYPRKAKNLSNKWKFVVNIGNFTQAVEVKECNDFAFSQDSSGSFGSCLYSGATGNIPELTSCKQIYTEHKLLALTDNDQLEVDSFMLPSACACFIQHSLFPQEF